MSRLIRATLSMTSSSSLLLQSESSVNLLLTSTCLRLLTLIPPSLSWVSTGTSALFHHQCPAKTLGVKKLIVLSRTSSSTPPSLPANAEVIQVDYNDHAALVEIFKKNLTEVVISNAAIWDARKKSALAAKEAGAKLFVPSEYWIVTIRFASLSPIGSINLLNTSKLSWNRTLELRTAILGQAETGAGSTGWDHLKQEENGSDSEEEAGSVNKLWKGCVWLNLEDVVQL
ncbi:hypothetical protein K435DRAFT_875993 [Dendrothele bispora CBS 962.96]|uniref:NmrA-like domain-containing protein n=1 Tax=Dendrothele bispora (strain CBS 962.96) TaxID=1314807 RepID=A0A4S8KT39_DENBC|nr:hypothetical protein K435DRAFT_875993 [Dendrothele bispora CBS 962.96]